MQHDYHYIHYIFASKSRVKVCVQWRLFKLHYLSLVMRKPAFCICENKDADQLRSSCAADQCLCFCYMDSTMTLLSKSKISSLKLLWLCSLVCVGPGRKPRRPVFSQRGSFYCGTPWAFHITGSVFLIDKDTIIEPRCEKTGLQGF